MKIEKIEARLMDLGRWMNDLWINAIKTPMKTSNLMNKKNN